MEKIVSKMMITGVVASLLVLGPRMAEAAEVTVGMDVASAYVWRGITFNDNGVLQPSVDIAHESGLGLNVWTNFDIGRFGTLEAGEFSEVDLTLSYAVPLPTEPSVLWERLSLSVGYIHYLFPQAGSGTNTSEIYISTGIDVVDGLSFGGDVYWDVNANDDAVYGNLSVSADLGTLGLALPEKLSLGMDTSFGLADKDFAAIYGGTDSGGFDWNLSVSAAYAVTETIELGVFLAYTDNLNSDSLPDQQVDLYGGFGLYYSF